MYIFNFFRNLYKTCMVSKMPFNIKPPFTHVVQIGDPILRTKSQPIDLVNIQRQNITKLIRYLKTITINDKMFGLSSCQIGVPLQIMCIQCPIDVLEKYFTEKQRCEKQIQPLPLQVWVNPQMKILDYNTNIENESCASVLSLEAAVKRYNSVSLYGFDEFGGRRQMEAHGFLARIIQHEMDHLNGVLYTDIMNNRTLRCSRWNEINEVNGMVEMRYYPKIRG